jgi:hypothetical protein
LVKGKISKVVQGNVKIGCEFFMQAEGTAEFISVETGVPGLFIDLTPEETLGFIKKRQKSLQLKLERCGKHLQDVQMHIDTINRSISLMGEIDIKEPA